MLQNEKKAYFFSFRVVDFPSLPFKLFIRINEIVFGPNQNSYLFLSPIFPKRKRVFEDQKKVFDIKLNSHFLF